MKKTHERPEPTWEMDTQWALKSIIGTPGTSEIRTEGHGDLGWLCESHLAVLDDEIALDLAELERKHASFVTTNSRRSVGPKPRSTPK
ncbi:MAG: hypothetical protein Q8M16_01680 [Pirellulaceae bacterium]|nr:hypothetical protein [Pirellulaceae bacterium]